MPSKAMLERPPLRKHFPRMAISGSTFHIPLRSPKVESFLFHERPSLLQRLPVHTWQALGVNKLFVWVTGPHVAEESASSTGEWRHRQTISVDGKLQLSAAVAPLDGDSGWCAAPCTA